MISAKEAVTTRFTVAETAPAAFTSTVSRPEVTLCSSCSQSMPSNRLHQPAHVGVLGVEVGRPAGDVGFNLQIQAVEATAPAPDQQRQGQHQHQHHPPAG